jgi:hypothetical protein
MGGGANELLERSGVEQEKSPEQIATETWLGDAAKHYRTEAESSKDKGEDIGAHFTQQAKEYEAVLDRVKTSGKSAWLEGVIAMCSEAQREREDYRQEGKDDPIGIQVVSIKPRIPENA